MRHLRWPLLALVVVGCALPKNVVRPQSSALVDTHHPTLGELIAPAASRHPGESGFVLFNTGEGAIQVRVALAEMARSSIDVQYFIWGRDSIGRALMNRIFAAADRGVRVRILVDDYWFRGADPIAEAIDAHPGIEVRVFNPFARRWMRALQLVERFAELNRRMHNKMFVVDGQVAVIGGRNLTDDYFGLGREICYRDFDLAAIGPVVSQAEAGFDRHWNSEWAYPLSSLLRPSQTRREWALARFHRRLAADRATFPYTLPPDRTAALAWLEQFRGKVIWGPAELAYDDPYSVGHPARSPNSVWNKIVAIANQVEHEVVGENPYLLPNPGMPVYRAMRARGVEVRLLTNSLASTDVVAVNAHYAKLRPQLVDIGVQLYEMKPHAASRELYIAHARTSEAHLGLHGKATVFDRRTVFVGSFNLNRRSMRLDTELALVVHSPELASQFLDAFTVDFAPENAWRITKLPGKSSVAWVTQEPGKTIVESHDPASVELRLKRSILGILPIGGLL